MIVARIVNFRHAIYTQQRKAEKLRCAVPHSINEAGNYRGRFDSIDKWLRARVSSQI